MSSQRVYVVVSGPPGSGKTTVARPLAEELGLPLIGKDQIKESLLDSLGIGDLEWSRRLGRASMSLLFALAADARGAVLDSTWSRQLSPQAIAGLGAPSIEVYCSCPPELAEARYRERLSTRHPGHHDSERKYEGRWTNDAPLGTGPLVVVDTSQPVDIDQLTAEVRSQTVWCGTAGPPDACLHNVSVHVGPDRFDEVCAFYRDVLGLSPVFEEPGHICCLDVSGGGGGLALCVHEAEPAHPDGTRELFFWVDDEQAYRLRAETAGHPARTVKVAASASELALVDPVGNQLRLHRRGAVGR